MLVEWSVVSVTVGEVFANHGGRRRRIAGREATAARAVEEVLYGDLGDLWDRQFALGTLGFRDDITDAQAG